jgi:hypothetical protein
MMMAFFNQILSKSYLLEPDRQIDKTVPIFKSFSQLIKENLFPITTIVLLILALIITYFLIRKKKQTATTLDEPLPTDPYEDALQDIEKLQSQRPSLSPKPYVFRLSEILRIYVERVFQVPAMELTGEEFMKEIASHTFFRNRYDKILQEFINQGDQIKYSKESADDGEMKQLLHTALHFVKDTHAKLLADEAILSK